MISSWFLRMQWRRTRDVVHLINRDAREQHGCRDEVRKRMYSSLVVVNDFSLDSKMRLVRLGTEKRPKLRVVDRLRSLSLMAILGQSDQPLEDVSRFLICAENLVT